MEKKYIFNPGTYEIVCDTTIYCDDLKSYFDGIRRHVSILVDIKERIISPFNIQILMEWLRNTSSSTSKDNNICAIFHENEFLIGNLDDNFFSYIHDKNESILAKELNNIFSTISFKINNILAIIPEYDNPCSYLSFISSLDFLEIQQYTDNTIGNNKEFLKVVDNDEDEILKTFDKNKKNFISVWRRVKEESFFKERCNILKYIRRLSDRFNNLYVSENERCFVWLENNTFKNSLTEKELKKELEENEENRRLNYEFWAEYYEYNSD